MVLLMIPLWMKVLAEIKDGKENYTLLLAKKCDITYSHVVGIVNALEKAGILKKTKIGRKAHLKLTKKGVQVRSTILSLFSSI